MAHVRKQRDEAGVNAIEWAIISGLALLLLVGLTSVVMAAFANTAIQGAADESLRVARAYDGSAAAADARARDYVDRLSGKALSGYTVRVSRTQETARVTITGTVKNPLGFTMNVRATSSGPVERHVDEP